MEKFIRRIEGAYSPYYVLNDKAHQMDHVSRVCNDALLINERFKLNINKRMIVVTAYTHDMFNHISREYHEKLAANYIRTVLIDEFVAAFDTKDREAMAVAVEEHRASFKGVRNSTLSRLLASADIGEPNLFDMIVRSYKFHSSTCTSLTYAAQKVYEHLIEKFGRTGYIKYPTFYNKMYNDEILELYDTIDELTVGKVRAVISTYLESIE